MGGLDDEGGERGKHLKEKKKKNAATPILKILEGGIVEERKGPAFSERCLRG